MVKKISLLVQITVFAIAAFSSTFAYADHTWNNFHWARTTNPFSLKVIDSVTNDWQFEFDTAFVEWNASSVLDLVVDSEDASNKARKRCKMVAGQMRVCNAAYGFNGWLGLATIGLDNNGHIDQGTAKVNDSYSSYWTDPNEKRHVMCQEIGHVFGLHHTTTDGSSQETCMDYSSDPNSISPNGHDYDQLSSQYHEYDAYNSYDDGTSDGGGGGGTCNAPPGKGCNAFGANASGGIPPMGVRIHGNRKFEVWVAPRAGGGLWIHHIYLVPDEE